MTRPPLPPPPALSSACRVGLHRPPPTLDGAVGQGSTAAGAGIDLAGEELGGQVPTSALDAFALGRGSTGLGLAAAGLGSDAASLARGSTGLGLAAAGLHSQAPGLGRGTDGASSHGNMWYEFLVSLFVKNLQRLLCAPA
jgi:hypothetical protein